MSGKTSGVGASQSVGKTASASTHQAVSGTVSLGVGDALSVSSTASFITVVQARIAKLPDVREAKVEALRAQLESDDYHPDGEAVAEGLVRDYTPPRQDS
ncbi:flagellar biosynthesis anti-sigma factor FlgM [Holophaga foetida]|uniref:flagellar biosynthesis anti-sigma factor FlgM n=1 Tax=Holophaga foetida TaxID=35839 RepID=UPI00130EEFC2|nr:flagellar biosynthesis anti-sigma factor FlgM [Holophaga foetida]